MNKLDKIISPWYPFKQVEGTDGYTGKPHPARRLNSPNGEVCDECGTELIDRCTVCGAPVCCPQCCAETTMALIEETKACKAAHMEVTE